MDELYLQSFCSLMKIVSIIGTLSLEKIEFFKEIGFGRLLQLPFKDLQRRLCTWLLFNYVSERQQIKMKNGHDHVSVDLQCVGRILGLPTTGRKFIVSKKKCTHEKFLELHYSLGRLEEEMKELPVGPTLHKCMLIFVCAAFINPNARMEGEHRLWDTIWELKVLEEINWGEFLLEMLNKAARTLMNASVSTGKRGVTDRTYIHGCVYLLQYMYLTSTYISNFPQPPVEELTDEKVRRRISQEITINKVFGKANVLPAAGGSTLEIVHEAKGNGASSPPQIGYEVEPPIPPWQQNHDGIKDVVAETVGFLEKLKSNYISNIALLDDLRGNFVDGVEILNGLKGALIKLGDVANTVHQPSTRVPCGSSSPLADDDINSHQSPHDVEPEEVSDDCPVEHSVCQDKQVPEVVCQDKQVPEVDITDAGRGDGAPMNHHVDPSTNPTHDSHKSQPSSSASLSGMGGDGEPIDIVSASRKFTYNTSIQCEGEGKTFASASGSERSYQTRGQFKGHCRINVSAIGETNGADGTSLLIMRQGKRGTTVSTDDNAGGNGKKTKKNRAVLDL